MRDTPFPEALPLDATTAALLAPPQGPTRWAALRAAALQRPALSLALLWLGLVVLACAAPALLATHDPFAGSAREAFLPPSAAHWFGTDQIGRDTYSRVIHGARYTVLAALAAVAIGAVIGTLLGTAAAFARGWADALISRFIDVLLAVPSLLLALFFVATLGGGLTTVAIAVGIGSIALFGRFSRAQVMGLRAERYVTYARDFGASPAQILRRHVIPNVARPILALIVIDFGQAVLAISVLGFLGYGVTPPLSEWGQMIADGRAYVNRTWWPTLIPGFVLIATVIALAVVQTGLSAPAQGSARDETR